MRVLRTWKMARYMLRKADEGCEVIAVPRWLSAEVHSMIWSRRTERAAEKWARVTGEVSLAAWQEKMRDRTERRS